MDINDMSGIYTLSVLMKEEVDSHPPKSSIEYSNISRRRRNRLCLFLLCLIKSM